MEQNNPTPGNGLKPPELSGVIGFFDAPDLLISATRKAREAKYRDFDAYTPYPVHGLEAAQGIKRSPIPYVTFLAGITGCAAAFALQYWTSAVDWPLNVGGKPFNSWPAFVPVMFELTILFGGLSTFAALLFFCRLPNARKRNFDPRLTSDRFALMIEAPLHGEDPEEAEEILKAGGFQKFSEEEAKGFLKSVGAKEVRTVYAEGWF